MTSYGKIIGGELYHAPSVLIKDDKQYVNPPEELLLEKGYFPIIENENTLVEVEGYTAASKWVQKDGYITQEYSYAPTNDYLLRYIRELEEKIANLTQEV